MPDRPATLRDIIAAQAREAHIPEALAFAVMEAESGGNQDAVSPKGAIGLFQLMPETAKELGVDPADPVQNIRGGLTYLRRQLDAYGGNVRSALAAYNMGPTAFSTAQQLPAETEQYIQRIFGRLQGQQRTASAPRRPAVDSSTHAEAIAAGATPPTLDTPRITPGAPPNPRDYERTIAGTVLRGTRTASPLLGAMVGGVKGAALGAPGGPPGLVLGALTGAGLGALTGEVAQMGAEKVAEAAGVPDVRAPQSVGEAAGRAGSASQVGMMGEAGGRVLGTLISPLLRPFAGKLQPYAQEALQTFQRRGGPPAILPSEVSSSRLLNVVENVAEGSLLGGARIAAVRQARQKLAEEQVLGVLDMLGPRATPRAAGEAVRGAHKTAVDAFRAEEKVLWDAFRSAADDIPVATPQLDDFIASLTQREAGAILPNAGATAARKVAALTGEEVGESVLIGGSRTDLAALPASVQEAILAAGDGPPAPTLTASQFQKTVSDLGKLVRSLTRAARSNPSQYNAQLGLAKRVQQLARADLETSLSGTPALDLYESATSASRLGNKQLFNQEVMQILKTAPEKLTQKLLTTNNSTAIRAVREAVGDGPFQQVQSQALQEILELNPRTGNVVWPTVATRLQNLGDDTLQAMFPGGHATKIKQVAELMQNVARQPAGRIGSVAIQLAQGSAAVGLATGTLTMPSLMILLTPAALARAMTNPQVVRWLTTGLSAPAGSRQAVTATAQFYTFLQNERLLNAPPEPREGPPLPRILLDPNRLGQVPGGPPAPTNIPR